MFPEHITLESVLYTALFGFVFGVGFALAEYLVARLLAPKRAQ